MTAATAALRWSMWKTFIFDPKPFDLIKDNDFA